MCIRNLNNFKIKKKNLDTGLSKTLKIFNKSFKVKCANKIYKISFNKKIK